MPKPITQRQKQLLEIIYQYINTTGFPPTFEEMREGLKVASNQSVMDLLHKLESQGCLKRNESAARAIIILPLGYQQLGAAPLVPLLGAAAAGTPVGTVEIQGEWQTLSKEVTKLKDEIFMMRVFGDSMINAGIGDGDMVLVKSDKYFASGDIVLAQVGSDATIKRFVSQDKPPYVYLKPENPGHKNILFKDDVELKGKVLFVQKNGQWSPVK